MSDFFQPNKNNKHHSNKKYKKHPNLDDDRKDLYRLNKSFKLRKREIEEEDNWENWDEEYDSDK